MPGRRASAVGERAKLGIVRRPRRLGRLRAVDLDLGWRKPLVSTGPELACEACERTRPFHTAPRAPRERRGLAGHRFGFVVAHELRGAMGGRAASRSRQGHRRPLLALLGRLVGARSREWPRVDSRHHRCRRQLGHDSESALRFASPEDRGSARRFSLSADRCRARPPGRPTPKCCG